jgi:hypothetical protein
LEPDIMTDSNSRRPPAPSLVRLAAIFAAVFFVPALLSAGGCGRNDAEDAGPAESARTREGAPPSAADWLASSLAAQDNRVYVYKDYADGLNNFTQPAFISDSYKDVPAVEETAEGMGGTSGLRATVDLDFRAWGGFMFLNGILPAGATAPLAGFEEPHQGLDLSGAKRLVVHARGGGRKVFAQFYTGGLKAGTNMETRLSADSSRTITNLVELPPEWRRLEIDLGKADLRSVGNGLAFTVAARHNVDVCKILCSLRTKKDPAAVAVMLDEIYFEFEGRAPEPMFLASFASEPPGAEGSFLNPFAYLYDNALAVLALTRAGRHERARQIADAMVYAYGHDRHYHDGRLRNAYAAGRPASFPGWLSPDGREHARLPSFYDAAEKKSVEEKTAVSTSTGNLAWAMLALLEVAKNAPGRPEYLETAAGIAEFVLTLKNPEGPGFTGGYEGWEPDPARLGYLSTEHNVDLVSAFSRLFELTSDPRHEEAANSARDFVLSMYDRDAGRFYTGTLADGVTVSKGPVPLDVNTWAILALKGDFPDGEKVLAFVESNMRVGGGYDFDADKDGVWLEGTAQAALAYKELGRDEKYREILAYLESVALPDGSLTAADRDGVTTGFTVGGSDSPWLYFRRRHLGATAWLAFAQAGYNPL